MRNMFQMMSGICIPNFMNIRSTLDFNAIGGAMEPAGENVSFVTDRKEGEGVDLVSERRGEKRREEQRNLWPNRLQLSCCSNMADLFSDPDLWQNQSVVFNMTAANTSSVYMFSPVADKAVNILMIIIMFITMVSMGCTVEVSKMKHHIVKPKGVAIAALSQYGIMPLTAFSLAKAFQLTDIMAVVILVCGCCPGGTLSNIFALALKGDMNLSILMTTCSTLLALVMMPLLLYIYCHGFNLQNSVPYVNIIISLVSILIPCSVGILINYYRPQYSKTITKVGLAFMMIAVVVIGTISSIAIGASILTVLSPPLMAIAALMPFIGCTFGYIISWLFRLNQSERRTVSMETGCQNTQLCSTILKLAFPSEVISPMFLFSIVYLFFQVMEAALLIVLFKCHQRFTLRERR
ncbi:sodium/bile acid cotransporter-like [Sebastes umbrosus]|uniref:sodium/bile acid cotransporter-like n=1 Tax=Sebastes umbrosus TaxID=72105 RepID=UPI00189EC98E|nr:sodium/bile acid cotransporter-like [Sebastes umbrosus]